MSNFDNTDEEILNNWYRFAASQPGFVGELMHLLCERQKTTLKQQQKVFGATDKDFNRLLGMPLPRPHQFSRDARRIAEVCQLKNTTKFVETLLLARNLQRSHIQTNDKITRPGVLPFGNLAYYQAAYDEDKDLDDFPSDVTEEG